MATTPARPRAADPDRAAPVAAARLDLWLVGLLAGGVALRLIGLDAPIVDQQAWRQADTAAIARNFFEEGIHLLRPRVDWRGTTSGVVETNFPLYPWLVAWVYAATGHAWEGWGRLLSALFSTLTGLPLYALARRLAGAAGADLWWPRCAVGLYLVAPLSWFFGRALMPEALMVLLSVGALWTFQRWLEAPGAARLATAAAVAGLCFAVKIPTLYLGFPLVALAWQVHGAGFLRRPVMWLYLLLVLLPPVLWHLHAHSLFEETGLTFGVFGSSGYDKWSRALLATSAFWLHMGRRFLVYVWTPPGCLLVAAGVAGLWPAAGAVGGLEDGTGGPGPAGAGRERTYLYAWLGALVLYALLVPEGNHKLHYYQIPFVPVGVLFAAAPLAALIGGTPQLAGPAGRLAPRLAGRRGRGLAILLAALVLGSAAYAVRDYYRPLAYGYYRTCLAGGRALDAKLPPDALLVVGDIDDNASTPHRAQSPTLLYYAHRKGWQITPEEFTIARLDSLAARGADFFVVPAGFVVHDGPFWQHLLDLGVSSAASYPVAWRHSAAFLAGARRDPGPERHVIVVRLKGTRPAVGDPGVR